MTFGGWTGSGLGVLLLLLLPASALQRWRAGARMGARANRDPRRASVQLGGLRALEGFLAAHDADAQLLPRSDERCSAATGVKTLLFACQSPDGHALAVLAETDRVDESRLAATLGVASVRLAPRTRAEELTGFAMGTLPPVGAHCDVPTVVDSRLAACTTPLVAGGGCKGQRLLLDAAELRRLVALRDARALVGAIAIAPPGAAGARAPGGAASTSPAHAQSGAEPRALSSDLPRPTSEARGVCELPAIDVDGSRVHVWGVIAAKRPMARTLCFVTVLPHPQLLPPEMPPRPGWDAPRALWRPVGAGLGRTPPSIGVQLVLGRALEAQVGKEKLAKLIRQLKVGNELAVVAAPAIAAAAWNAATLDGAPGTATASRLGVLARVRRSVGTWFTRRRARAHLRRSILGARQIDLKVLQVLRIGKGDLFSDGAAGGQQLAAPAGGASAGARASQTSRPAQASEADGAAWLTLPASTPVLLANDERSAAAAARMLGAIVDDAEAAAAAEVATGEAIDMEVQSTSGKEEPSLAGASRRTSPRRAAQPLLGIDVEWKPEKRVGKDADGSGGTRERNLPALLQLATRETVLLLDLLALCKAQAQLPADSGGDGSRAVLPADLSAALARAFGCSGLVKLSIGSGSDFARLRDGYPREPSFQVPYSCDASTFERSYVDIAEMACDLRSGGVPVDGGRAQLQGLAKLSKGILGVPLDKRLQCSPWGDRPLTPRMLEYAALDAHVLTSLYDRLLESEVSGRYVRRARAAAAGEPLLDTAPAAGSSLEGEQGEERAAKPAARARTTPATGNDGMAEIRTTDLVVGPALATLMGTWLGSRVPRTGPAGSMHAKDAALLLAAFPALPAPAAEPTRTAWAPPFDAVRAYDRRAGLVEVGDALVVFVSFQWSRKYPNSLQWARPGAEAPGQQREPGAREAQLELSWWLPSHVGEGHPMYAKLLGQRDADSAPAAPARLLFARVGKGPFTFCGRITFARHLDEESAGLPGAGIAWTLLDAPSLVAASGADGGAFAKIMRLALKPSVAAAVVEDQSSAAAPDPEPSESSVSA